jgi:hypothetical protein
VFFPVADAFRVIRAWRNWTHGAPATMTSAVALLPRSGLPGAFHDEPATAVGAFAVDPAVLRGLEAHLQVGRTSISGGFPMAVQRHRPNDDQPTVGAGPNQSMLLARLDDWAIDALLRAAGAGSAISYELWRLGSFGIASRRQRPQARFLLRGLKVGALRARRPCSTPRSPAAWPRSRPGGLRLISHRDRGHERPSCLLVCGRRLRLLFPALLQQGEELLGGVCA